jgi:hypothetical protein
MNRRCATAPSTWRPALAAALAAAALLLGLLLVLAPGASAVLGGGPWPPLHARCVGAMALSCAVALWQARATLDPAALRMPLLLAAAWAAGSALALLRHGTDGAAPAGLAALGAGAWWLARADDDTPAPAEHADALLLASAAASAAVALLLLAAPARVAPWWPWRLGSAWVVQYAPLFAAWATVLALAARERRRYVRAPVLWGLLSWAAGTLGVSLWHASALRGPASVVGWLAVFVGAAAAAAWRLGLLGRLGRWSRDAGTAAPRH